MKVLRVTSHGALEGDIPVHQYKIGARKGNIDKRDAQGNLVYEVVKGQKRKVQVQEGKLFTPETPGMHDFIQKTYGTVRGVVVHCTDVICDAADLARRTATSSPRQSSYNLLIGTGGDLHQLASIYSRTWHAGRGPIDKDSDYFGHAVQTRWAFDDSANQKYTVAVNNQWKWPVVDGRVVENPNNWGPGIEIMGKPGRPTSAQLDTLAVVLRALYADTKITPDTVWQHGDLDPLHRKDTGWPELYEFAEAISQRHFDERENHRLGTGPGHDDA